MKYYMVKALLDILLLISDTSLPFSVKIYNGTLPVDYSALNGEGKCVSSQNGEENYKI